MVLPSHAAGTLMVRWYQMQGMKSVCCTPESLLSGQKGTVILPSKPLLPEKSRSAPVWPKSKLYVHVPLRFIHCSRSNCGRGYSLRGRSAALTLLPKVKSRVAAMSSFVKCFIILCGCLVYGTSRFSRLSRASRLSRTSRFSRYSRASRFSRVSRTFQNSPSKRSPCMVFFDAELSFL